MCVMSCPLRRRRPVTPTIATRTPRRPVDMARPGCRTGREGRRPDGLTGSALARRPVQRVRRQLSATGIRQVETRRIAMVAFDLPSTAARTGTCRASAAKAQGMREPALRSAGKRPARRLAAGGDDVIRRNCRRPLRPVTGAARRTLRNPSWSNLSEGAGEGDTARTLASAPGTGACGPPKASPLSATSVRVSPPGKTAGRAITKVSRRS